MIETILNRNHLVVWIHLLTWLLFMLLVLGAVASTLPFSYLYWKIGFSFLFSVCSFYLTANYLVPSFFEQGKFRAFIFYSVFMLGFFICLRFYVEEIWLSTIFSPTDIKTIHEKLVVLNLSASMRLSFGTLLSFLLGFLYRLAYTGLLSKSRENELLTLQYQTELKHLLEQVNPHFLFNTIHNIYSLALSRDQQTAPMLLKLSEVLRYSLYQSEKSQVPLKQELATLNSVLAIYSMRHDPPLLGEVNLPDGAEDYLISPLLLLPLIENMFKHGDSSKPEKWDFQVWMEGDKFHFYTQNPIGPQHDQSKEDSGLGLENVKKRMELIYGNQHEFTAKEARDLFFVKLSLSLSH